MSERMSASGRRSAREVGWRWRRSEIALGVVFAATGFVAACGGGGGGGGADSGDGGGGGGSGSYDEPDEPLNLVPGQVVAALEVVLPASSTFVLHGTVPLPKGAYIPEDGDVPFTLLDWDSTPVETQLEVVSRYPAATDGADVIEVLATVHRNPGLAPSNRAQYALAVLASPPAAPPLQDAISTLTDDPAGVPLALQNLLENESGVMLTSRDVFDHLYLSRPLASSAGFEVRKHGAARATVRSWSPLLPVAPTVGSNGTLSCLLGVHSYLTTTANSDVLLLDLRFTNAGDGSDPSDASDDPQGKVYFQSLELGVPNGWNVVQDVDDPADGTPYVFNGQTIFPIVAELAGGALHVVPSQGQFHRRMALCPIGMEASARALLDGEGLAFARRGLDPVGGGEYWSWWNEDTARYFPQRFRLPSLAHIGINNLRQQLANEAAALETILENGSGQGDWPVQFGQLGWAHPYGVQYGAMTGGNEINLTQGSDILEAASPEGYRNLALVHRMQSDRQPNALYHKDGRPARLEDWLAVDGGGHTYIDCYYYMKLNGSHDPFGLTTPPTFQVNAVAFGGLAPSYEPNLLAFESHDLQHLVRYTRCAKALAWIGNDELAQDDLAMQAELVRFTYHPYYNSAYGHVQETGMLADLQYVQAHPYRGVDFGRGEGWGLDTVSAAYSLASSSDRARFRPWFDSVTTVVATGQVPCSGLLMAAAYIKFLDGKYRTSQIIEQAIIDNAVRGMLASVYLNEDPVRSAMLRDFLASSAQGVIRPAAWNATAHSPWRQIATGPLNVNSGVYCSSVPGDGHSSDTDSFQIWPTFAWGYEIEPQALLLTRAAEMAGGGTLIGALEGAGLANLHNRAPLIALAQELAYGLPIAP